MTRIVAAAVAALLLWGGTLLADEASLVKVDLRAQEVTLKLFGKDHDSQEQTLDARRVRIFNAAGKELKLEDVDRLRPGTRLEYKAREGRITELKVLSGKF
jgi:hypothetical protein